MRWQNQRESSNVEDVRGRGPLRSKGVGLGCGGIVLIGIIAILTGQNPLQLLQNIQQQQGSLPGAEEPMPGGGEAPQDEVGSFVSRVLSSTEDIWGEQFAAAGKQYPQPKLVRFADQVQSACGLSSAAMGPFYCPLDNKVYLDTSFFDLLEQRFGATGDFAAAYVIAHEVGHHVQNVLGISDEVQEAQRRAWDQSQANELSVKMELQADCLAGVWAHYANKTNLIEPGDFEEGLNAAAAIGDDRIQAETQGYVVPESFTHGRGEDRMKWLRRGLESGDSEACDTFQGR